MVWDNSRFQELESRIMHIIQTKRYPLDVPFYRFYYEPQLELRCISEFERLIKRLKAKGISAELIWLNKWLLDSLQSIDSIDNLIAFEQQDRKSIFDDLSHPERGLVAIIAQRLTDHLFNKDISHCAILVRVGCLFPFVHISALLTLAEGKVRCILVIPYPGKDGEMLNYGNSILTRYYRGEGM